MASCPNVSPSLFYEWSKTYAIQPKNHIISHRFVYTKPFHPSYENECRPNIHFLLGWEYYRIWKRDLDEYIDKRNSTGKVKKIKRPTFEKPKAKDGSNAERFKMKKFQKVAARTDHKGKDPKDFRKTKANDNENNDNNFEKHEDNIKKKIKKVQPIIPIIMEKPPSKQSISKHSARSSCSNVSTHSKQMETVDTSRTTKSCHGVSVILNSNGCQCIITDKDGNPCQKSDLPTQKCELETAETKE